MNILYISTALEKNMFSKIKGSQKKNIVNTGGLQESTNKFHGLIIKGLSKNNCKVTALSGLNVSDSSKILWKHSTKHINENIKYVYPFTINIKIIKQIFNAIMFIFYIADWYIRNIKKEKCIIVDGAYVTILPSLVITTKIFRCKKIAIVADVYDYMADIDGKKNTMRSITKWCYKNIDGFVFLTEQMVELINSKKVPYIIMEGLIESNSKEQKVKKSRKTVFMYAGALKKEFGVENLVKQYMMYDNYDSELWIYGDGIYRKEMLELIKSDLRIKYFGIVDNDVVVKKEKEATFLINPRNKVGFFTKYSFPSKNMEYLLSGTPMIGYKLEGIPDDYDNYIFYINESSKYPILEKIQELSKKKKSELKKFGDNARDYVIKYKNNKIQSKRIIELIEKVGS